MFRKQHSKESTTANSFGQSAGTNCFDIPSLEDDGTYATIDGGMVTRDEVSLAVNRGSGIFIGNYFVGITEKYQCYINSPFSRFT